MRHRTATNPGLFRTVWLYRSLIRELTHRAFSGRYKGSIGGAVWSLASPLFLLLVYTFAFGVILKIRWSIGGDTAQYALMILAGLVVFNACAECLSEGPRLITDNPNFVKKVRFPLELLPIVAVLATLLQAVIAVSIWILGYATLVGTPKLGWLWLPVIYICLTPVLLTISWTTAAIGVINRDIRQLTGLISHSLMFLTPIFYAEDATPVALRPWLELNPLTFPVECLRQILFLGKAPPLLLTLEYFGIAALCATLSFKIFMYLRPSFADIL